ncbi:hypothetical protein M422DRAFT_265387 [Sphaerobolus stellatus SS14]|uniref:SWIM-type domain-containing protein n=1 Tax=Sphaerobolus stellatus (strain SS14) TaxID=990650 RepID=A0A0C9V5H7_SPHS4|nr:hypothetical protein M422DRAFT_265387 [Sphaerobolus stellatus SS14]
MASGSGDPLFSGVNITSILPAPEKSVFQRGGEIKVHIRFLHADQAQQDAFALAYQHGTPFFQLYTSDSSAQSRAQGILKDNGLDIGNLGDLGNRWSIRWSSQNSKGSEQRREKNLNILRIAGIVSHNEECCKEIMQRLPAIPLHEHVWQIAIEQLEQGASITAIQARNRELCLAKAYHGQSEWNPATANVRYELLPSDSRSLYRQFSRRLGVDITREAQYNIDDWLNKDSSNYKREIAAAVFYYQGRIAQEKRLRFHVRQCWTNHRKKVLKIGRSPDFPKLQIQSRLYALEEQLIISINYVSATQIVDEERSALTRLKSLPDMDIAVTAGLAHIKYLTETWMPVSLWHSWSQKGRLTASEYFKTTIEGVIPTTNHLEAFNEIYQYRTAQEEYKGWVAARFRDQAGGVDLLANRKAKLSEQSITSTQSDIQSPIVWWPDNRPESAIEEANYIVEHGRFDYIRWTDAYTIMGTCASRTADIRDPGHMRYNLWITTYGMASCSCLAVARGVGACKHLWALRIKIKKLIEEQKIHPGYPFLYPVSMEEAKHIYNVHYPRSSHPFQQDPIPTPIAIILPPDTASELAINSTSTSQNIGALNLVSVQASLLLVGTAEVIETNNPADMEDLDTESSSSECEIDCNNTQKFNGDVRNGIAIQLQERVSHATQNILPRLLSFSDLLAQMVYQNIPVDVIDEIPELLAVTSRIHAQLGMVSDSQISVQAVQATYSNIPKPLPSFPLRVADSTGRIKTSTQLSEKRPLLLPPSPESKQRRKTSHGIR